MDDTHQPNDLNTQDDTRAASPVIGVVLIIGISIILAATIAPVFLDFGNNISKSAKGAVSVEFHKGTNDGEIDITYLDRGNTEKLEIRHSIQTNPGSNSVSPPPGRTVLDEPGDSMQITESAGNTDENIEVEVIVVAFLESDEKAVIYTNTEEI